MRMTIVDHTDAEWSEKIRRLMAAAYTVEGDLIGVEDFPPLRRTASEIRATEATFFGCLEQGELIAAAEVEAGDQGGFHIGGFVVHPSTFRRGVGSRLLSHVLHSYPDLVLTVSTATLNEPAISMYEKHGFKIVRRWEIQGIAMVTLETNAEMGVP